MKNWIAATFILIGLMMFGSVADNLSSLVTWEVIFYPFIAMLFIGIGLTIYCGDDYRRFPK